MTTIFFPQVIGKVNPPAFLGQRFSSIEQGGLGQLLNLFFNILIVAGGIYALFNFILAGYAFLGAGDNPDKVSAAWRKIYQTIIGLLFIVSAFVLGGIVGLLLYKDPMALLKPSIPTP